MFRLCVRIKVNEFVFTGAIRTEIVNSLDNMTDTALIELPNIIYTKYSENVIQQSDKIVASIKRGDPVWVYSGFDTAPDKLKLKFQGFVTRATGGEVITIQCEDFMYALKNINVPSKRLTNITLKEYIDYILQESKIEYELVDPKMNLGTVQIDNNSLLNAVNCLETLKTTYGLNSYIKGKKLIVGKIMSTLDVEHNFIFQHNIIEDNLTYNDGDDINLVIKGISILDNDTKIERYAYLENDVKALSKPGAPIKKTKKTSQTGIPGEQITLNYYNKTANELEQLLLDNFDKYIYKGYSGNFITVLNPDVNPGEKVNLYNITFPERNGQYRVKSVKKDTSMDGGYQTIDLDYKIKDL